MKIIKLMNIIFLGAAVLASGCAQTNPPPAVPVSRAPTLAQVEYGVIDSIETIPGGGSGIGAGAVVGGVVGGVLGNQVGGGSGNTIATIAGVVGGAVVGHQVEKSNRPQDTYRIKVRLNHNGYATFTQGISDLRVGDRVRVENNVVSRD
ncbi:MAG: glycine zipper 2TM domain-containing protein [Gallionella sp.]|nr:glycine zipper 2TM domain-containing protein [Gallionella sp.]MDD4960189.1 glycine zipper 2TM domain-containing protein [Gallionella sp.]